MKVMEFGDIKNFFFLANSNFSNLMPNPFFWFQQKTLKIKQIPLKSAPHNKTTKHILPKDKRRGIWEWSVKIPFLPISLFLMTGRSMSLQDQNSH